MKTPNRKEQTTDEALKAKVDEAFADPRASLPARDVFRRLRAYHAAQTKSDAEE